MLVDHTMWSWLAIPGLVFPKEATEFIVSKLKDDFNQESLYQKKQREDTDKILHSKYAITLYNLADVYLHYSFSQPRSFIF